jgi:asparagine synthase (glutamine-hydrolysing)
MPPVATIERLVDLLDPAANLILNMSAEEAAERVGSGDPAAVRGIAGHFALVHKRGTVVRMARSVNVTTAVPCPSAQQPEGGSPQRAEVST